MAVELDSAVLKHSGLYCTLCGRHYLMAEDLCTICGGRLKISRRQEKIDETMTDDLCTG